MASLVKWNLHWSGAGEEGQVGVYCTDGGVTTQAALETAVASMVSGFSTASYATQLKSMICTDQKYDQISAYYYADAAGSATYGANGTLNVAGTSSANAALVQSACVSLHTGHAGASYRGRMYLPATGLALAAHQITSANCTSIATAVAGTVSLVGLLWDFARSLDAAGSGGSVPVVYSRKLNVATPITAVAVDSRPDVQRRRAKSEVATSTATLPYTPFTG